MMVWRAEGKTHVHLEVFVDSHSAARLNAGKDQLGDNLTIQLEGADDLSVSFTIHNFCDLVV